MRISKFGIWNLELECCVLRVVAQQVVDEDQGGHRLHDWLGARENAGVVTSMADEVDGGAARGDGGQVGVEGAARGAGLCCGWCHLRGEVGEAAWLWQVGRFRVAWKGREVAIGRFARGGTQARAQFQNGVRGKFGKTQNTEYEMQNTEYVEIKFYMAIIELHAIIAM